MEFADVEFSQSRASVVKKELQGMGYEVFNPWEAPWLGAVFQEFGLSNVSELHALKQTDLDTYLDIISEIRKSDLDELRFSDLVIGFLDKSARGGVSGELTLASELGIPVYCVLTREQVPEISGWTISCSEKLFMNINDCMDFVRNNPVI